VIQFRDQITQDKSQVHEVSQNSDLEYVIILNKRMSDL